MFGMMQKRANIKSASKIRIQIVVLILLIAGGVMIVNRVMVANSENTVKDTE